MTQVVTVSANTAAYAVEALRPSARVSGQAPAEKSSKAKAEEIRRSASEDDRSPLNAVPAPAVTLFFLTAQRQPNSTYERAHEEYLSSLSEYRVQHETAAEADASATQVIEADEGD